MNAKTQAAHYWSVLRSSYPRRSRFRLDDRLKAFGKAFPYQEGDLNARQRLTDLLHELAEVGQWRLPKETNRRTYDYGERIPLPGYASLIILPNVCRQR